MNARYDKIDEALATAMMLLDSPRGREAVESGYYLALFTWLYGELERGRVPTGVPVALLEEWRRKKLYGRINIALPNICCVTW